ncbi:MAG: LON peptidase substrate-binding domain-containing protein [Candidatus Competibacter sp.]|nr:LON peptidase substrate-binding domain-containing protein [Candidatus Competibacter sp.]MDG4606929.1 LON peptidase substrate-binding domain-containing protein [Candidatus Contendobacter sp.]HRD49450.1 LON peptidase substrate-binding domain-containing protein [Candidatus Contendobacter sp.]
MTATQEFPLFPLKTVLFPGGVLPLKIFETRYLDMVSYCLKSDSGFGVVMIYEGNEAGGQPVSIHPVGTLARIVDFDPLDDGLLGVTCLGVQRLRVVGHRIQPDNLLIGQVLWLPDDPVLPPLPSHEPLVRVLRDVLDQENLATYARFLAPDWRDAAWIGNRLTELLPLPLHIRQALLEMTEPHQRLDILLAMFQEQRIA